MNFERNGVEGITLLELFIIEDNLFFRQGFFWGDIKHSIDESKYIIIILKRH